MDRQAVSSSNISSIGYDADLSILEVEFRDGAVYQYYDVPEVTFDGLMQAPSHGSYLAQNIKGHYRYARL